MMRSRQHISFGSLLTASLLAATIAAPTMAQDAKPQKTKGISLASRSTLQLGEQIPELEGYAMQLRTIVLQPGAVAAYHSHAKRPVVAYLVNGEYVEHRDDLGEIVHKPGDQWVEGAEVAHWSENRGTEPAVLINVEVFRPK
jgi:quercetin dioxygenase-like cupin family protein